MPGRDEFKNARFWQSDFSNAQFRGVVFANVVITDSWLLNASISGMIQGLTVNGVEVAPLVEAELDRGGIRSG